MNQPSLQVMKIVAADRPLFEQLMFAEGLLVVGVRRDDPLQGSIQAESVTAIASILAEDIHDRYTAPAVSNRQAKLFELAESLGYVVAIDEGLDQSPGTEFDPLRMKLRHPEEEEEQSDPAADPVADPNADPNAAPADPNAAAAPPQ